MPIVNFICLVKFQGSPLISEQRINLGGTFLLHAFHNDYSAMKCDPYYLGKDVIGIARISPEMYPLSKSELVKLPNVFRPLRA